MIVSHVLSSLQIGGGEARLRSSWPPGRWRPATRCRSSAWRRCPRGRWARRSASAAHRSTPSRRDAASIRRCRCAWARCSCACARKIVHTHTGCRCSTARRPGSFAAPRRCIRGTGRGAARRASAGCGGIASRFLDAYVAVSPALRDLARSLNDCAPGKLSVIENGIDVGRFAGAAADRGAARAALGIPAYAWVVGSVGRLATEKAFPMLVRAAAPLLGPQGHLIIVGDGAERGAMGAEAEARGVSPFVRLTGARTTFPACCRRWTSSRCLPRWRGSRSACSRRWPRAFPWSRPPSAGCRR